VTQDGVLAVNAGSSSLKFGLYDQGGGALWSGQFSGLEPGGAAVAPFEAGAPCGEEPLRWALSALNDQMQRLNLSPRAVVHRVVHGGSRADAVLPAHAELLAELYARTPLAPLHQPYNLAGVHAFARALPDLPQLLCFDTAFHATLPALEQWLPLPQALHAQGIRRYGFHGLSYAHAVQRLREVGAPIHGRALLAHLGSGASVCSTDAGHSVASSMGFSALDGLMMGTRSGSLDPGVLLHLLRQGWSVERLDRMLNRESGLRGVSGLSGDWRTLRASRDPEARLALDLFTHRLKRELGAQLALLEHLDLLAFTGGIGEHDADLRREAVKALACTGVALDDSANRAAQGQAVQAIHASHSPVQVWVVPADEGRIAALAAWEWLRNVGTDLTHPRASGGTSDGSQATAWPIASTSDSA
jgi:acetate kinase